MNREQLLLLCEHGHTAPSADNTQPWHFIVTSNKINITYDTDRVAGKTFPPDSLATLLSIGSVIEAICIACETYKINYSLALHPELADTSNGYACFTFEEHLSDFFTDKKNNPLSLRHTNRLAFKALKIDSTIINNIISTTTTSEKNIQWIDSKQGIKKIAQLIQAASRVRFQTPEVHQWLMQSLRFKTRGDYEDGLHISTLDLPPMGAAFMRFITPWKRINWLNKLAMYKLMAFIEALPLNKAPGIMALHCKNTSASRLQLGRQLFQVWLELNKSGLAIHPYFVITDQLLRLQSNSVPEHLIEQVKTIEKETTDLFNLTAEESLCMLLRVGYPNKQAIRSRRLNLADVVTLKTNLTP